MAFIHAGGTIIRKELKNSKIMVDTGCIVGFTAGIDYNIQRSGGLKSMVFGGRRTFLSNPIWYWFYLASKFTVLTTQLIEYSQMRQMLAEKLKVKDPFR